MGRDARDRRRRGAADDSRASRGSARRPRGRRARRDRAGRGHRPDLRAGGRPASRAGARAARARPAPPLARREATGSHGSLADGGERVSLPPRPHSRHRLRRDPQARAGDLPRAVRRVGRQRQPRGRDGVRGDPRVPPRAGAPLPLRARPAGRPRPRARCRRLQAPGSGRRRHSARRRPAAAILLGRAVDAPSRGRRSATRAPPGIRRGTAPGRAFRRGSRCARRGDRARRARWPRRSSRHASLVRLLVQLRAGDASAGTTRRRPRSPRRWPSSRRSATTPVSRRPGGSSPGRTGPRCSSANGGGGVRARARTRPPRRGRAAADARGDGYAAAAAFGSTPVAEAIERCEQMLGRCPATASPKAVLTAMLGEPVRDGGSFEERAELVSREPRDARGARTRACESHACALEAWRVEMLAGDLGRGRAPAPTRLRRSTRVGEKYLLSTVSGLLAQTLYELGRYDEAEPLGRRVTGARVRPTTSTRRRCGAACCKLLARAGMCAGGRGTGSRGARDPGADRRRPLPARRAPRSRGGAARSPAGRGRRAALARSAAPSRSEGSPARSRADRSGSACRRAPDSLV